MEEINIHLTELVDQNKLSYREAEFFVDYAYELCLNDVNDEDIVSIIKKEIKQEIEKKKNEKLLR